MLMTQSPREIDVKPYVEHHPLVGYVYRPGVEMTLPTPEGGRYRIRVNAQGIRGDREYSAATPPNVFRVVVLGDSVAAGQYCSNDERFSDLLEAGSADLEVINLALEGTGTDQQLLLLQDFARRFEFDALLFCPYVENIRRNLVDYRVTAEAKTGRRVLTPKPRFTMEDGRLVLHNVPVPRERPPLDQAAHALRMRSDAMTRTRRTRAATVRLLERLGLKRWLYRVFRHEPFPEYRDPAGPAWQLMAALVAECIATIGERPMIIVPQVYRAYVEHPLADNYLRRFRSLARPGRVYVFDILPWFRRLPAATRRACFWSDACHLTPLGHRVVAEAIRTEMQKVGLLPADEPRAPTPQPGVSRQGLDAISAAGRLPRQSLERERCAS